MLRAFIAIEIPEPILELISQQTSALRRACPYSLVRWIPNQNIHLTLKFLGDSPSQKLEELAQQLVVEIQRHRQFSLTVKGIGVFPNNRRPRIVWIGIENQPALIEVFRSIESTAAGVGYTPEERSFSPHLTIGRVRPRVTREELQKIGKTVTEMNIGPLGNVPVESIHIIRSELKQTGAVYTRLYTAKLSE
jgi:2'-5' RNA ligase